MVGQPEGERISIIRSAVLIQSTCVTDGETDRQTDWLTELPWNIRARALPRVKRKEKENGKAERRRNLVWNYTRIIKKNIKELFYALPVYFIKIKYHRQVPAPGPNFSVPGPGVAPPLSLDFSKAFDTARHLTLLQKLAQLDIPDHIYNCLADFFNNHSHCTGFGGELSTLLDVTASIIQGSAIGPAAYVVTAGDLVAAVPGNSLCKYANTPTIRMSSSLPATRRPGLWNSTTCRDGPSRTT